jgi:hypothetical protein
MKIQRSLLSAALLTVLVGFSGACVKDTVNDSGDAGGESTCGDGKAQGDEYCDGDDLNGETCESASEGAMTGSGLKCKDNCKFDVSDCDDAPDSDASMDGGGGAGG